MSMNKLLLFIAVLALCSSCATKKQIIYFQDAETLNGANTLTNFEPLIEENDILHITVSSLNQEVVAPFQMNTPQSQINNQNPLLRGYLVKNDGTINYPVLGTISVAGKTRGEVTALLQQKLSDFITDVVVDVRIMNYKVTVLGAVSSPGVYRIQDESVTLPEALGLAGDLTSDANRTNIMVIREVDEKQEVARLDITQTNFFQSPYYFLKQNDVVYVEPSLKGVKKSGFIPDIPSLLSLFTVILSTVIIITR